MRKGYDRMREIAILRQFLAIEPHFVRKGSPDALQIAILPQFFWRSNLISCERVRRTLCKSQFYRSFWRSNLISCERVRRTLCKSQFCRSFWRSNLISCERVAFRAVLLALPRAFKREIEKKERARGQERM